MIDRERRKSPGSAEHARLADSSPDVPGDWKQIGPYVSERWGTVREDCSADGDAWFLTNMRGPAPIAGTRMVLRA